MIENAGVQRQNHKYSAIIQILMDLPVNIM